MTVRPRQGRGRRNQQVRPHPCVCDLARVLIPGTGVFLCYVTSLRVLHVEDMAKRTRVLACLQPKIKDSRVFDRDSGSSSCNRQPGVVSTVRTLCSVLCADRVLFIVSGHTALHNHAKSKLAGYKHRDMPCQIAGVFRPLPGSRHFKLKSA